jgi:hypothetical protein
MAYQSFNLAQIRQMLQEKVESVPFWADAEANDAINEALLMWNALTGFWKGTQTAQTTPGSWDYAVYPSLVFGSRVEFNGKGLAEASIQDMDDGHPGWQGEKTTDGAPIPTEPTKWLPLSIDMIAIWPADAAGGNTLTIQGVAQTPRLVTDADFIDIGAEELNALLGYALHALALKEGGERFAGTMKYFQEFLKAAAEENDQLLASAMFRQFIGIDISRQMKLTRGLPTDYDKLGERKP